MAILQHCVVESLEKCSESTPANLVESMFKFVRNETPCVNITVKPTTKAASTSSNAATLLSSLSALAIVTILAIQLTVV